MKFRILLSLLLLFDGMLTTMALQLSPVAHIIMAQCHDDKCQTETSKEVELPVIEVELVKVVDKGGCPYFWDKLLAQTVARFSGPSGTVRASEGQYYRLTCLSPYLSKWISTMLFFQVNPPHSDEKRMPVRDTTERTRVTEFPGMEPFEYVQDDRGGGGGGTQNRGGGFDGQSPVESSSSGTGSGSRMDQNSWTGKTQLMFEVRKGYSGWIGCKGDRKFSQPAYFDKNYELSIEYSLQNNGSMKGLVIPCNSNTETHDPQPILQDWQTAYEGEAVFLKRGDVLLRETLKDAIYDPRIGFQIPVTDKLINFLNAADSYDGYSIYCVYTNGTGQVVERSSEFTLDPRKLVQFILQCEEGSWLKKKLKITGDGHLLPPPRPGRAVWCGDIRNKIGRHDSPLRPTSSYDNIIKTAIINSKLSSRPRHESLLEMSCSSDEFSVGGQVTIACTCFNVSNCRSSDKRVEDAITFHTLFVGTPYQDNPYADTPLVTKQVIGCPSPFECEFYLPYTNSILALRRSSAQWSSQNFYLQFTNNTVNYVPWTLERSSSHMIGAGIVSCNLVPFYSPWSTDGMAIDYFFTGLDKKLYLTNYEPHKIPKRALISIDEMPNVLYTNDSIQVVCEASSFLLISKNIQFSIKYQNGSRHYLTQQPMIHQKEGVTMSYFGMDETKFPVVHFKSLGLHRRTGRLKVGIDMVEIQCLSPWYNSTEWLSTSRQFEVRVRAAPKIKKFKSSHFLFRKGKLNHLECVLGEGEPTPKISWLGPENEVIEISRYALGSNKRESILKFGARDPITEGKYTCIVNNEHGSDRYEYQVNEEVEQEPPGEGAMGTGSIIGISLPVFGFLVLALGLGILGRKYLRARQELRNLTEAEYKEFVDGEENPPSTAGAGADGAEEALSKSFKKFEILPTDLDIARDMVLGEGQFGKVFRGFLRGAEAVAVKTTKSNTDIGLFKSFLGEVKIMAYVGHHPHVVDFRGAVIKQIRERILYVIVDLSPFGSLHSYLRKQCALIFTQNEIDHPTCQGQRQLTQFLEWCIQIADGMEFLGNKKLVHGDLASRNVLVFNEGVVKISDFGLSSRLYGYSQYIKKQKGPLPWAWMPMESLRFFEFSTKSDVWAYGVTVWEIFSLGQFPYPGLQWTGDLVDKLDNGLRVAKPKLATNKIYQIILKCCEKEPASRPQFEELKAIWRDIVVGVQQKQQQQQRVAIETETREPTLEVQPSILSNDSNYLELYDV